MRHQIFGAMALSVMGAAALAHSGATGAVMARMQGMTAMRDVIRDLAPIMQGTAPYDEAAVLLSAKVLQSHSGEIMTQLFPKEPIPKVSYAQPEIWTDWDRFTALARELDTYAEGLAEASGNGLKSSFEIVVPALDKASVTPIKPARISIAELMGVKGREPVAAVAMIATNQSQGEIVDFAVLAADDVFESISRTCASCHALFRRGN